jgi:uncharacterized protein (TIGR01777 family)
MIATWRSTITATADHVYAWHARAGAFERLNPPWNPVTVEQRDGGIGSGSRVVLAIGRGPLRARWHLEHRDNTPGRSFRDVQVKGPFAHWEHEHLMVPLPHGGCELVDSIEFALPGRRWGRFLGEQFVIRELARLFAYRHRMTRLDVEAHLRRGAAPRMHVAVTGASGLIGRMLVPFLEGGGHRVTRLERRRPQGSDEVYWDPQVGVVDREGLEGIDAVVHLAGENIAGGRWTAGQRRQIRDSRVRGTRLLASSLARLRRPPRVLISASATGYYGDRGEQQLDETAERGDGWLAELAGEWEAATAAAARAGIRVVNARLGVVLDPRGGMLARLRPPFELGLGGVPGNGRQYVSWVSIEDAVGAIHHALFDPAMVGAINVTAPEPVTFGELATTLGRVLRRPAVLRAPAAPLRLALGEMADELLLASTRVLPTQLRAHRYAWRHTELEGALAALLGRVSAPPELETLDVEGPLGEARPLPARGAESI